MIKNNDYWYLLYQQERQLKNQYQGERKAKKFFAITIPVLVLEIVASICLIIYLIFLPKNYCNFASNYSEAVFYVDNKEVDKIRLDVPEEEQEFYFYGFDLILELPDNANYLVEFTVTSDKYEVMVSTTADGNNGVYSLTTTGGKTKVLNGITIMKSGKLKNFEVDVNFSIKKIYN